MFWLNPLILALRSLGFIACSLQMHLPLFALCSFFLFQLGKSSQGQYSLIRLQCLQKLLLDLSIQSDRSHLLAAFPSKLALVVATYKDREFSVRARGAHIQSRSTVSAASNPLQEGFSFAWHAVQLLSVVQTI